MTSTLGEATHQLFQREPLCNTTVYQQIEKARQELKELQLAVSLVELENTPEDRQAMFDEFADVLVCLTGAAHKMGISWSMLTSAYYKKLQVNLARTWTRQEDGTYQHD